MGKITNIYITHEYHKIDWDNHVFIEVIKDGKLTSIESSKNGYYECNNDHVVDDYRFMWNHIKNGLVVDLMKDFSKEYRVYTDNMMNKAIFVDVYSEAVSIPFKQIVYIKNNKELGTKSIFGGEDARKPYFLEYKPTNEIITKKELISGITKEIGKCFPELKIKLGSKNQNTNE